MINDQCELYLSQDIMQGEEVPFFIQWNRDDVKSIKIEFEGFEKINELYNICEDIDLERNCFDISELKTKNYLGGVLKTQFSDEPFFPARLKSQLVLSDGQIITLEENRKLYATILQISKIPELIEVPFDKKPIEILLKGSTTVFIDIITGEDSEIRFELPKHIQSAIEKFVVSLINGLTSLKEKYPDHSNFVDLLLVGLQNPERMSERQLIETAEFELNNFNPNKDFIESLGIVLNNAIHTNASLKDAFFRPLLEYFEASATDKGFLQSPFLCMNVKEGKSYLKGKVYYQNILEKEGVIEKSIIDGVEFQAQIQSSHPEMIPLKDLIDIKRIDNE